MTNFLIVGHIDNSAKNSSENKKLFWCGIRMHCVIEYVLVTRNLGLKLEPSGNEKEPWDIIGFRNSNYDGDLVSRRSLNAFILYVLGALSLGN